ncbi:DNA topoisomerase IB [Comamonas endophytica]|uniref:DNA topoisomerase n=2 Tax=Comamonas endophytica TaxID=2949090 RepID=A0ABY6G6V7_9BURK|nr:DNA topoisomerase IB [Acidovorax sp. 5MLIR]UYG50643.1 DNA topoisomerase IB [Acidovorax sp. 5MLIR]
MATLIYVDEQTEGWRRVRRGKGFSYVAQDGSPVRDPGHLERIRKLAIPPAYTDVWICPDANGHLQATGRDARGRKQYRYHALWQEHRTQAKFERMREFGHHLPAIRRAVERDLAQRRPGLELVAATAVRLLDATGIRIGNDEYSEQNGSYGLTTLKNRHAKATTSGLTLHFKGKSGVMQKVSVADRRVARIVRRCQELPGQRLFQFLDENDELQHLRSDHVNDYLRSLCDEDFTAKDFRTWHASVTAMELALQAREANAEAGILDEPAIADIVKQVAQRLGNTSAVCRKFYIHPEVLSYCAREAEAGAGTPRKSGLSAPECALLQLLDSCQPAMKEPVRILAPA